MDEIPKSEGNTRIRPSWGGNCGKRSDPPPTARKKLEQTSSTNLDLPPGRDSRSLDRQLLGTERALNLARAEINRLHVALSTSRREVETLRMRLRQIQDLLTLDDSTT